LEVAVLNGGALAGKAGSLKGQEALATKLGVIWGLGFKTRHLDEIHDLAEKCL